MDIKKQMLKDALALTLSHAVIRIPRSVANFSDYDVSMAHARVVTILVNVLENIPAKARRILNEN